MQPATQSSNQLGRTLGTSRDWPRRLRLHHLPLGLASAVVLVLFMTLPLFEATDEADHGGGQTGSTNHSGPAEESGEHGGRQTEPAEGSGEHGGGLTEPAEDGGQHGGGQTGSMDPDEMIEMERMGRPTTLGGVDTQQLTVATGYVATGLLALTLLIGPGNLLLRRRNPVSSYLARDVGTWAAIFSVIHVFYGLQVHGRLSDFLRYFVVDGSPLTDSFGLGNWTGLAATVIVVGLLATSSDFALRKLKARRWKRIQRLNYALFALVIAHAVFYGALLRMTSPFTLLLLLSVIAVFVGQAVGIWLWRRRHALTTAGRPS